MQESMIQKAVLNLLESLHRNGLRVFATRTNSGKAIGYSGNKIKLCRDGWPDVTACVNGKFVGIECKTKGGRLMKTQEKAKKSIEDAGGIYLIVRELKTLRDFLRREGVLK